MSEQETTFKARCPKCGAELIMSRHADEGFTHIEWVLICPNGCEQVAR